MVATLTPTNFHDRRGEANRRPTSCVAYLDLPGDDAIDDQAADLVAGGACRAAPGAVRVDGVHRRDRSLVQVGKRIPSELQVGPDPTQDPSDALAPDGPTSPYPRRWPGPPTSTGRWKSGMGFRVDLDRRPGGHRLRSAVRPGGPAGRRRRRRSRRAGDPDHAPPGAAARVSACSRRVDRRTTPIGRAPATRGGRTPTTLRPLLRAGPDRRPGRLAPTQRRPVAGRASSASTRDRSKASPNYYGHDQAEARAMNVALWPATLGYFIDQ